MTLFFLQKKKIEDKMCDIIANLKFESEWCQDL